jgi:hypothetical protein
MNIPLPTDYTRCLAHPFEYTRRAAPIDWCHLREECARHQSIMVDLIYDAYNVAPCLCACERKFMYIEAEA